MLTVCEGFTSHLIIITHITHKKRHLSIDDLIYEKYNSKNAVIILNLLPNPYFDSIIEPIHD